MEPVRTHTASENQKKDIHINSGASSYMISLLKVYLIPCFTSSPLWSIHLCWKMRILLCA